MDSLWYKPLRMDSKQFTFSIASLNQIAKTWQLLSFLQLVHSKISFVIHITTFEISLMHYFCNK